MKRNHFEKKSKLTSWNWSCQVKFSSKILTELLRNCPVFRRWFNGGNGWLAIVCNCGTGCWTLLVLGDCMFEFCWVKTVNELFNWTLFVIEFCGWYKTFCCWLPFNDELFVSSFFILICCVNFLLLSSS